MCHELVRLNDEFCATYAGLSAGLQTAQPQLLNDLYVLNYRTWQWVHPITGGMVPGPRYCFSMSAGRHPNEMLVFGGMTSDQLFSAPDLFRIADTS